MSHTDRYNVTTGTATDSVLRIAHYSALLAQGYGDYEALPLLKPTVPQGGIDTQACPLLLDMAAWTDATGMSTSILLQAAWSVLVTRYARTDRLVIGRLVVSSQTEDHSMIATVPGCTPGRPLLPWLAEISESLSHSPEPTASDQAEQFDVALFETMIVHAVETGAVAESVFLTAARLWMERTGVTVAVTVGPAPVDGVDQIVLAYDTRRIHRIAAEELVRQLACLLGSLVQLTTLPVETSTVQPTVASVQWLDLEHRQKVLHTFNPPLPSCDQSTTFVPVVEMVDEWAKSHPEVAAQTFAGETVTYETLSRTSTDLACRLRQEFGVTSETRVALFIPKSHWVMFAMLAVLKAGGAFVPIDVQYPADRTRYILTDCDAPVVLTTAALRETLAAVYDGLVCVVDVEPPVASLPDPASSPALPTVTPDQLAYVIYTSGTTGRPKGVLVEHHGLSNIVRIPCRSDEIGPGVTVFQVFSVAFDAFLYEGFVTLCNGGTLVLSGEDPLADLAMADIITATPSFLALVDPDRFPRLRQITSVGEAFPVDLRRRWESRCPIGNGYGPTEATVFTHYGVVAPDEPVTIGKPIAGTASYIVDDSLQPVPVGVPGELLIGGVGVARGYNNLPELSATRFLANPFGPGRVYRTGDYARWLPDGRLEYLGRIDHQVKVNGFRIELGEIDTCLLAYPGVTQAVTVVHRDRLIGYVTPATVDLDDLRVHLATGLPRYMVPTYLMALTTFPRTRSDKVDREALPIVPELKSDVAASNPADSAVWDTQAQAALAAVWGHVLRRPVATLRHDSHFFRLGGDSIVAILTVAQCRQRGYRLTVPQIFDQPTLRAMASQLQPLETEGTAPDATLTGPATGPVPLTPIQRWFFEWPVRRRFHFNQSFNCRVRRPLTRDQLEAALTTLVAHHDMLRARYTQDVAEGNWCQEVPVMGTLTDHILVRVVALTPADRDAYLTAIPSEFDLAHGPLLAAVLLTDPVDVTAPAILHLTVHHLFIDLVSWRIIVEDLNSLLDGQPLPAPSLAFRVWAEQLDLHASQMKATEWPAQSFPDSAIVPSPLTHRVDTVDYQRESGGRVLDRERTAALVGAVAAEWRVTPRDLVLAAFAAAYAAAFSTPAVALHMEGHGREPWRDGLDVSRTVGWFTSVYPLVLATPDATDLATLLLSTKAALQQIPRKGFPFGVLRHSPGAQPSERAQLLAKTPAKTDILFNFFGRFNDAGTDSGAWVDIDWQGTHGQYDYAPGEFMTHNLNAMSVISGEQLRLMVDYNAAYFPPTVLHEVMDGWLTNLCRLADHRVTPRPLWTPADVPQLGASSDELRAVFTELGRRGIVPTQVDDMYPTTAIQAQLLAASLQDPSRYLVQIALSLTGELDEARLRSAWLTVCERQPLLRTVFVDTPAAGTFGFVQVALTKPNAEWPATVTWAQNGDLEAAYLCADRARGMALDNPLIRIQLAWTPQSGTHRLLLSIHHALFDGWSFSLLLQDWLAAYQTDSVAGLPVRPAFRAFVGHINEIQRSEADRQGAATFWADYLRGSRPTPLPYLGPPTVEAAPPAQFIAPLQLPMAKLHRFSQQHGLTVAALLRGAFALALGRLSGSEDVTFGSVVSGRNQGFDGIESLAGPCLNTLPVRVALAHQTSVLDWLKSLHDDQVRMIPREHDALVTVTRHAGHTDGTPLFRTMLVFENYPPPTADPECPLRITDRIGYEVTEFPLAVMVSDRGDRYDVTVFYHCTHYSNEAAAYVAGCLDHALATLISATPTVTLGDLVVPPVPTGLQGSWVADTSESHFAERGGLRFPLIILKKALEATGAARVHVVPVEPGRLLAWVDAVDSDITTMVQGLQRVLPPPLLPSAIVSVGEYFGSELADWDPSFLSRAAPLYFQLRVENSGLNPTQHWLALTYHALVANADGHTGPLATVTTDLLAGGEFTIPCLFQFCYLITTRFGLPVTPADLYRNRQLGDLATLIDNPDHTSPIAPSGLTENGCGDVVRSGPLSAAQWRSWLRCNLEEPSSLVIRAAYRVTDTTLNLERLQLAVLALADRHEILRTTFQPTGPTVVQSVHAQATCDVSDAPLRPSFDPQRLPLFAVTLSDSNRLTCAFHVLIMDGPSLPQFLVQLMRTYEALSDEGLGPALPAEPTQLLDLIAGDPNQKTATNVDRSLAPEFIPLDLPTDLPRPTLFAPEAQEHRLEFTPAAQADLARIAEETDTDLVAVWGTMWGAFVSRISHRQDVHQGVTLEFRDWRSPTRKSGWDLLSDEPGPDDIAPTTTSELHLTVEVDRTDRTFLCLTSAAWLFTTDHARRLLANFVHFVEAAVAQPAQSLDTLDLVAPAELSLILDHFSHDAAATTHPFPADASLPTLLRERMSRFAGTVAIQHSACSVTYADLIRHSATLAGKLQGLGVTAGDRVAVIVQRHPALLVTLLGLWHLGAVYVPIDAQLPPKRRDFILQTADCRLIVNITAFAPPDHLSVPVLPFTLPDVDTLPVSPTAPMVNLRLDQPAYLIFTSGTTGVPKGVLVSHAGLANLAMAHAGSLCPRPGTRILHPMAPGFDGFLHIAFIALCHGGTLVLPTDTEGLLAGLATVDTAVVTPSMLAAVDPSDHPQLQIIGVAAEPLPAALADQWADRVELYNYYGPTEATICSHIGRVYPGRPITIGKPLANTTCYIVDPALRPVPIGVTGEIMLGGQNLALGYYNQPELTETKFVPNPFGPGKLYHTGDLGRWTADGQVLYVGRIDEQVKLRGFRIELAEVESCLRLRSEVKAAVALVHRAQLAAFVAAPNELDEAAVRRDLADHLPHYMLPSRILTLQTLPLTVNGKVDYQQLRSLLEQTALLPSAALALSGQARVLREVLAAVLGIAADHIDMAHNFYRVGGDSISAIQTASRCRQLGWQIAVPDLLRGDPLGKTAQSCMVAHASAHESRPSPTVMPGQAFPLTPIQRWFLSVRRFRNVHRFNQTFVFELTRPVGRDVIQQALTQVRDTHPMLRATFTLQTESSLPVWTQTYLAPEEAAPVSVIKRQAELADLPAAVAEVHAAINIHTGPLLSAGILQVSEADAGLLILSVHHLVVDLVSWSTLLEDLAAALNGAGPVPATLPFPDWAAALNQHGHQSTADDDTPGANLSQITSWASTIDPNLLVTNTVGQARTIRIGIATETSHRLLCPTPGLQTTDLLIAALAAAFHRWQPDQPSPVIDTEGHGRRPWLPTQDLARTVGWFTTVLALAPVIPASSGPAAWIRAAKAAVREATQDELRASVRRFAAVDPTAEGYHPGDVAFNFLGQTVNNQALTAQGTAPWRPRFDLRHLVSEMDGAELRAHLLDVVVLVTDDGTLAVEVTYPPSMFAPPVMAKFQSALTDEMDRLTKQLTITPHHRYWVPLDFPLLPAITTVDLLAFETELTRHSLSTAMVETVYPCTPLQAGLLAVTTRRPAEYALQLSFTLRGLTVRDRVYTALQAVVRRHPILRTRFLLEGFGRYTEAVQVVTRNTEFPWFDAASWSELGHDGEAGYLAADRQRGFHVQLAPMLRLTTVAESTNRIRCVLTSHHAILDGWSNGILLRELHLALTATADFATLPAAVPYEAFVRHLGGQNPAQARKFWSDFLTGVPKEGTQLRLPAPLAPPERLRDAELLHSLYPDAGALRRRAEHHGLTVSSLLRAAWALLLHAYTGQTDVVFGVTVAGRAVPVDGIEHLMGFCINTIPFRATVDPGVSLLAFLRTVGDHSAQVTAFEHSSLADISRWIDPAEGRATLFNTILVYENYPSDTNEADPAAVALTDVTADEFTEYPVSGCFFDDPAGSLCVRLTYKTAEVDGVYVGHLAAALTRYIGLIAVALETHLHPSTETTLAQLALTRLEQERELLAWSQPAALAEPNVTVVDLIHAWSTELPDHVAIEQGLDQTTYATLWTTAGRIAHQLLTLVATDPHTSVVIGLLVTRHPATIVAMLGVLRAGFAYVPIDATNPADRQIALLTECACPVVVDIAGTCTYLGPGPAGNTKNGWHYTTFADLAGDVAEPNVSLPLPSPDDLVYIVYTSGSTGRPKGVQILHRGLANLVQSPPHNLGVQRGERVLQLFNLAFDGCVNDIYSCLANGGTLVLNPPISASFDNIDVVALTPSLLAAFDPAEFGRVGRLMTAAEPLPQPLADRWAARFPMYNLYGPSEATVCTHVGRVEPGRPITLGRPIAGSVCYVLDALLRLVPTGAVGELFLGGPNLARGYLHRPDLDAQAFCANPFGPGKLYRTGDLVRWLADGALQYMGRTGDFVKVRGFRIELGEIDAVLSQCPGVDAGAALVHRDRIYACVAPAEVDTTAAHDLLAAKLPTYMVPHRIYSLSSLPTTANNKVDRAALNRHVVAAEMAVEAEEASNQCDASLPQDDVQRRVVTAMAASLHLDPTRVGLHASFFQLGGDSISAIRYVARLRDAGVTATVGQVFDHPTPYGLAAVADVIGDAVVDLVVQDPVVGPFDLTPVQSWFWDLGLVNVHRFNQSFLLELTVPHDPAAITAALCRLVTHHDILRVRFNPTPAEGSSWAPQLPAAIAVDEDLLVAVREDPIPLADLPTACVALTDRIRLDTGPVSVAGVFHTDPKTQWLFWSVHHLAVDLVSWRILLEDLAMLLKEPTTTLPKKTVSYLAWSAHLREYADQVTWPTESTEIVALYADTDVADPLTVNLVGARVNETLELSSDITGALFLGPTAVTWSAQPVELLLAGFAAAYLDHYGAPSMQVDVEGHGRQPFGPLDLSRTVGWFTAIYPVTFRNDAQHPLTAALRSAKQGLRGAPHAGLAFGMRKYLGPDSARLSYGRVAFNYLGRFEDLEAADAPFHARSELLPDACDLDAEEAWPYLLELNCRHDSLDMLLQEASTAGGFSPGDVERILPATPLQEGLVVRTMQDPSAYLVQMVFDIVGNLDLERYRGVWNDLTARYEALRTRLHATDQLPGVTLLQFVLRTARMNWHVADWTDCPPVELSDREAAFIAADRQCGFTLDGPLVRVAVLTTGSARHRCIFTVHHTLLDGWSNSRLLAESLAFYHAIPLDPPVQFHPFVRYLTEQSPAQAQTFWQTYLDNVLPTPAIQLPVDPVLIESTEESRGDNGGSTDVPAVSQSHWLTFSTPLDQLTAFTRRQDLTVATVLRALWGLLLARYVGNASEVTFGVVVSGRNVPILDVERLVGMCINTVAVRVRFPAEASVQAWLRTLHRDAGRMIPHEHHRLVDVKAWAGVASQTDLFQSLLVYENYPVAETPATEEPEIRYDRGEGHEFTEYPLSVCFVEDPANGHLRVRLLYDATRYLPVYVEHMAAALDDILTRLVQASPDQCVADLFTLPPAEAQLVLHTWAEGPTDDSPDLEIGLHNWVVRQAQRDPDAVALEYIDQRWTYAELHQMGSRVAHWLQDRGLARNRPVALVIDRCPAMVFGLLGTLLAGGAYCPMEASNAADRLRHMLHELDTPIVLTTAAHYNFVTETLGVEPARVGCLDDLIAVPDVPLIDTMVDPNDLAYVIFTSGTTGRPKGVPIRHRGIVNFVRHAPHNFSNGPGTRVMQFLNVAFDGCISETFTTLANGATLVLREEDFSLTARRVTNLICTPSALAILDPADYPNLQVVATAGEPLPYSLVQRWAGRCTFYNAYGPSEVSIGSHTGRVLPGRLVSVGIPLANTACYVLDEALRPVPAGVTGELYLAGRGLSPGYWQRPDLTERVFLPNPFGPGRIYRTGDLGRWLPDGGIQILGRSDSQVKLRGFRIELGELESTAELDPAVAQAAAVVKDQQLVLYLAPSSGDTTTIDCTAVSDQLGARLPAYMVPHHLITLATMPLTSNGKVDRRQLAGRPLPTAATGRATLYACDPAVLGALVDALAATLNVDPATCNANASFFELGGDSISAIQLVSRAKRAGLDVTVAQVFKTPILAQLAGQVRFAAAPADSIVHRTDASPLGLVPLTPIQHWFLSQPFKRIDQFNMSFLLGCRTELTLDAVREALHYLVRHHDMLRVRLTRNSRGDWQQNVPPVSNTGEATAADLTPFVRLTEETFPDLDSLSAWVHAEQTTLSLAQGPILAVGLVTIAAGAPHAGTYLFVTVHHFALDLVSWRIMLEDLEALLCGRELPPKSMAFRQWAALLESHAQTQLATTWPAYPPVTPIPLDFDVDRRAYVPLAACRSLERALGPTLTDQLFCQLSTVADVKPQELMVAALVAAVQHVFSTDSLEIELESHGRHPWDDAIDLSRTVGWFTVTYPLPFHPPILPGATDAAESATRARLARLRHVKQRLRAVPNHGFPYSLLSYPKSAETGPSVTKPDLLFNYLGRFEQLESAQAFWRSRDELLGEDAGNVAKTEAWNRILDAVCKVDADRGLVVCLTFNTALHRESTATRLVDIWRDELACLLTDLVSGSAAVYCPADFPLLDATEAQLDTLVETELPRLGLDLRQIETLYPCAPLQEGLLGALLRDATSYTVQTAFDVRGPLDPARFKRAWDAVGQAHAILRTRFLLGSPALGGAHLQLVLKQFTALWYEADLTDLAENYSEWERDYLGRDRQRGFRPHEPLLRFALIRVGADRHRFLFTVHHSLADGWSSALMIAQLLAHYIDRALPTAVADYEAFIRYLVHQDAEEARMHWANLLSGITEPTVLSGPPIPVPKTTTAAEPEPKLSNFVTVDLPGMAGLNHRVQSRGITFATLLRAAWGLVLHRYTDRASVTFGVVVSGRNLPVTNMDQLIGLCINNVPFRVDVDPTVPVDGWLRGLHGQAADGVRFEHCRLTDIHRWGPLGPGTALFNTALVYENYPVGEPDPDCPITVTGEYGVEHTDFDLSLCAFVHDDTLTVKVEYQPAKFEPDFVGRLAHHFTTAVYRLACAEPAASLGSVDVFDTDEATQLTPRDALEPTGPTTSVLALIEARTQATPDRVAMRLSDDRTLTYNSFWRRAGHLAVRLLETVIAVGTPASRPPVVALLTADRAELAVGQLTAWRAGAAFLVLDPIHPTEHLTYILQDMPVLCVLVGTGVDEAVVAALPTHVRTSALNPAWGDLADADTADPVDLPEVTPQDPAWMVYTSGSTDHPKGVWIDHAAAAASLTGISEIIQPRADDVVSPVLAPACDAAIAELWVPLLAGATVVTAPLYLPDVLATSTVLSCTPSLLATLDPTLSPRLRCVVVGGEVLPPALAHRWSTHVRLVHCYGSCETSIYSHATVLAAGDPINLTPIRGALGYVLDAHQRPVPIGTVGELYISGATLAREYFSRSELTAAQFLPNPFGPGRVYRTGDAVRLLDAQGSIAFVGRLDDQVKVQGFRVELGDVKAALLAHPGVDNAYAAVQRGHLVGFVTPASLDSAAVLATVRTLLPAHMVPESLATLDTLPRTPQGRVDRRALPALEVTSLTSAVPTLPTESLAQDLPNLGTLLDILADVLQKDRSTLNPTATFFQLGGDSLVAVHLAAKCRSAGLDLRLADIDRQRTVRDLARSCTPTADATVYSEADTATGQFTLTPVQRNFFRMNLAAPHEFRLSILLQSATVHPLTRWQQVLLALMRHHDLLRSRYDGCGPINDTSEGAATLTGWVADDAPEVTDWLSYHAVASEQAMRDLIPSFLDGLNYAEGPLVRAGVFDIGDQQYFLFTAHHLVVDLVSLRILVEDLETLMRGFSLPPKTLGFRRWSALLTEWARQLQPTDWPDMPSHPPIAPDYPLTAATRTVVSQTGATTYLDANLTRALFGPAAEALGAEPLELMLTALVRAFVTCYPDRAGLVLEFQSHGRQAHLPGYDVSRTVGWFTALYPVSLTAADPHESLTGTLRKVQAALRTIPHRGFTYPLLRHRSAADRERLGSVPQYAFNYLGRVDATGVRSTSQLFQSRADIMREYSQLGLANCWPYLLDFLCFHDDDRLAINVGYSTDVFATSNIERLATTWRETLEQLLRSVSNRA
ncbi:hypothetical protein IWQ60_004348 [Tieghemiomyces parasiticus]|uniref:Carrier domain-containing protein n=1 Tax=Tieghemiomyces parasiticus TaxID=78921 RepID=A0A9W8AB48_9FUNG|nr:hypothetical protein IWQ60_004348 [Tieghemiomyces parasiticus]